MMVRPSELVGGHGLGRFAHNILCISIHPASLPGRDYVQVGISVMLVEETVVELRSYH